ncbi:MAG: phasin family protein [Anaerolineales bacterium]|nr:phasin family protein [Anaerolineales bacterium]
MSTQTQEEEPGKPGEDKEEHYPMLEAARKILLAGIGAMAIAQDEIEEFVQKLVDRGEIAEKDGRKLVREIMDKRRKRVEHAEAELTTRIEDILNRMSVPTKKDIDALSEKIAILTRKVEQLKK